MKLTKSGNLVALKNSNSINDLRKLPLTTYNDYHTAFRKTLATKTNPYTSEKVHFWASSTGSSGNSKLFPITQSVDNSTAEFSKYHVSHLIDAFGILSGPPEMIFVMPGQEVAYAPGLPIGQIGYYHYQKSMPAWAEDKFTFKKELYFEKERFNSWHLIIGLMSDCLGITTSIPARLNHFFSIIQHEKEALIEQLENEEWPIQLAHKPDSKRINYVIDLLKKNEFTIKELWPSLKFICTWQASSTCARQFEELQSRHNLEGIQLIDQVYTASEGVFNFPLIGEVGGPVNLFGIILEFYHEQSDTFFWPWELKQGEIYDLIITNSMGLTRYKINDKVICTGYFEKIAKIKFHSRSLPEINLGWGLVSEEQLISSLSACGVNQLANLYFKLNDAGNGLQLVSHQPDLAGKLDAIENALIELNENYGEQIKAGNFEKMSIKTVTPVLFYQVMLENSNTKRLLLKE